MFDTFLGLPVHALVVHAVVVLVPLAALGLIAIAVYRRGATRTSRSSRWSPPPGWPWCRSRR